ncbi:MAG: DUF6488 family protein [Pseudomonadota bacterium]
MKTLATFFFLSLLGTAQQVAAHADHDHAPATKKAPITEQAAINMGRDVAAQLSMKDGGLGFGKLPVSWSNLPAKNIKLHKKGEDYYIVAVANESDKKTLYVLMSTEGEVFDANFTGEFKNLK